MSIGEPKTDLNDEPTKVRLILKGFLAEMPEAERAKVLQAEKELRRVLKEHGDAGIMAIALIGAELQSMNPEVAFGH